MASELGVVVVGLGMAGKIRVRDIQLGEHLDKVSLKGIVSRRADHGVDSCDSMTTAGALARQDVQAVIVCTENSQHHHTIRQALAAEKHVLVEFPLVLDYAQVDPLYTMAKDKGVVLYEENIALLSQQHLTLKQMVKEKKSKLISAHSLLTGSIKAKDISSYLERTGMPLYPALSMLQCLMDLFGDLEPCEASMEQTENSVRATAKLRTKDSNSSEIVIETHRMFTETPMRKKNFQYKYEDGNVIDDKKVPMQYTQTSPGLFLQDLMQFVDVVRGKKDIAYNEWLTRRSLEITSQLVAMTTKN